LEDLLFRELVLEKARETQLDELAPEGAAVVALYEKAVARHLHRDGAEAFAHAHRAHVADDGASHSAPVDTVVIEEAMIFRGDERLLHCLRDDRQRNVETADDGEVSDE